MEKLNDNHYSEEVEMLTQITAELAISLSESGIPALLPDEGEALKEEIRQIKQKRLSVAQDTGVYRNPNVPWDDSQIPYHCECGVITYSDMSCGCLNSHYEVKED